jgi:hypothetical protein
MNNTNTGKCPQLHPSRSSVTWVITIGQSTPGHSAVSITEKCRCLGCPPSVCQHGSSYALKVCTVNRGNIAHLPTPQRLWAIWIPRKRDECGWYVNPCLRKAKFPATINCCPSDAFPACTSMPWMDTIYVLRFQVLRYDAVWNGM